MNKQQPTPEERRQVKHWMKLLRGPKGDAWRKDPDFLKWVERNAEWILDRDFTDLFAEVRKEMGQ